MDYSEDDLPRAAPERRVPLWLFVKPAGRNVPDLLRRTRNEVAPLDLLQKATPGDLEELPCGTQPPTGLPIIVDHLEDRLHECEWNVAVLSCLEALALRYKGPVVVLSTVDPLDSLSERLSGVGVNNVPPERAVDMDTQPQGTGWAEKISAAEEFERWVRVLAQFSQKRLVVQVGPDDPVKTQVKTAESRPPFTVPRTALIAEKAQQLWEATAGEEVSDARFWTIWSQCTRPEKLVLRQLAEEGFINPNNREVIRSLGRRWLIYRDPALQLMSKEFKQFVLRAESRQTIARWEGETEASWLSGLQTPLLFGFIGVAAFFFITQEELFTTVVALVGAFAALLPRILQPFGMLRGQLGERRSGGDTGS